MIMSGIPILSLEVSRQLVSVLVEPSSLHCLSRLSSMFSMEGCNYNNWVLCHIEAFFRSGNLASHTHLLSVTLSLCLSIDPGICFLYGRAPNSPLQRPRSHLASELSYSRGWGAGAVFIPRTWEPAPLLARAVLPFVGREASELKQFHVSKFPAFLPGTMPARLTK